jgi:hypothetical protein
MNAYPPGFKAVLHAVLSVLFFSGLLLMPGSLEMRLEWGVPWSLDSGSRVWVAAGHAASYFATLLLLGALWTIHMRSGWLRAENTLSGSLMLASFGLLMLSGLGLYYAGDEALGRIALYVHLLAGLTLPLLLGVHILGARQARLRVELRSPAP